MCPLGLQFSDAFDHQRWESEQHNEKPLLSNSIYDLSYRRSEIWRQAPGSADLHSTFHNGDYYWGIGTSYRIGRDVKLACIMR